MADTRSLLVLCATRGWPQAQRRLLRALTRVESAVRIASLANLLAFLYHGRLVPDSSISPWDYPRPGTSCVSDAFLRKSSWYAMVKNNSRGVCCRYAWPIHPGSQGITTTVRVYVCCPFQIPVSGGARAGCARSVPGAEHAAERELRVHEPPARVEPALGKGA